MRARNIKPGFFRNEQLMQVAPLGRLLFAGLWCLADREGRLLDRPNQIKWDVLPADDCDVGALLDDLAERGFIRRYSVDGKRCIAIPSFLQHQHPHPKEKANALPPPPDTAPAQKRASTRLNPESLNPDILIPDTSQPIPSKYDIPLQLEDYRPPTSADESLLRIAKHWQSITGETLSLSDRQHIRRSLDRGLSEDAILSLIASSAAAQAQPLRLTNALTAMPARACPKADAPPAEKQPLPSISALSAEKQALPSADTPSAEKHTVPSAGTPSAEKQATHTTVHKTADFFAAKDGNAKSTRPRKPTKPRISWQEGFFLRG